MKYSVTHNNNYDDDNTFLTTLEGHGSLEEKQKIKGDIRWKNSSTIIMLF